jgi:two-component system response regulator AtoC
MHHVLIVDDDPSIRRLLVEFLEQSGYRADSAEDGESALSWLAESRPDMVLLDVRLPGISGIDVLKKTQAIHPSLPVIVISGYADEELAREALRLGAYDFFLKPFDLKQVELRLATKLGMGGEKSRAEGQ